MRAQILAEVEAERERLDQAGRQVRAELAEVVAANEVARGEHAEAVRQAVAEHRVEPEPPQLPTIDAHREALHRIQQARSALMPASRVAMADASEHVEDEWQTVRAGLDVRARKLADQVEKLAGEYREWWRLVREVRQSAERRNPNSIVTTGPSTQMRPEPDPEAVITVAAGGGDLCAPGSPESDSRPGDGRPGMD